MADKKQDSLSQSVYDSILKRLLNGELRPGEILTRRQVADWLDVSMAPVSEAMIQLEMAGFIESLPRKGTRIRPVKDEDLFGSLMIREAIELQAAYLYHGQNVTENKDELLQLARKVDAESFGSLEKEYQEIAFHTRLIQLSNCKKLIEEYTKAIRISLFYALNTRVMQDFSGRENEHIDLVKHLESRDSNLATNKLREHLRNGSGDFIKRYLHEGPPT